ncbi:hypothetical protein POX19_26035, partial [Klebsiella pneumoniae]
GLAIDQIAQSGLSSLSVIYYSAQLFRLLYKNEFRADLSGYPSFLAICFPVSPGNSRSSSLIFSISNNTRQHP